jgi:hypothetical protein
MLRAIEALEWFIDCETMEAQERSPPTRSPSDTDLTGSVDIDLSADATTKTSAGRAARAGAR